MKNDAHLLNLPPQPRLRHQVEALLSDASLTMQSGALGSGKTMTNAWWLMLKLLQCPAAVVIAGAPFYAQTETTIKNDFLALIEHDPRLVARMRFQNDINATYFKLHSGFPDSVIYWREFVGNNPKKAGAKVKSINATHVLVEEADSVSRETFEDLIGRMRYRPPRTRYKNQMMLSTNPSRRDHYLYDMFFRNPTADTKLVRSKTLENPYLPADYYDRLLAMYSPATVARYLEGEWGGVEGTIFPDFSKESHAYSHALPSFEVVQRWAGLDFGGTHPHVIVWYAMDFRGDVYIERCWVRANVSLSAVAEQLNRYPVPYIYCDHDVADRLTLQNDFGVNGLIRAKKERTAGIVALEKALMLRPGTHPQLRVHISCTEVFEKLGSITYEQADKKIDDDVPDAVRYGFYTHFASQNIRPSVHQMRY